MVFANVIPVSVRGQELEQLAAAALLAAAGQTQESDQKRQAIPA